MVKNVGSADRVVRIVVALGLAVIIYLGVIEAKAAEIAAGVIAAYLLLTGLFGTCLIYKAADIDTCIQEQPYSDTDDRSGL
jgi:hypothetical protein